MNHLPFLVISRFSLPQTNTSRLYLCSLCLYCAYFPRVPGGELIERILEDNDLTEGVVVRYLSHLLAALDTLHQMNIAHLDIKVGRY